jgi:hypothetical protein
MGIKCWNLGFNAHDSKTFIICSTTNIANEWYWLVENDKKKGAKWNLEFGSNWAPFKSIIFLSLGF